MSYIGNTAENQNYVPAIDYFNGDGSTVAFTASRPIASVAQVQITISNVPQNPGSAYTVSGNTITFTSAPPSGTANIYVYYTSPNTQVVQPGQGTVGTAQIANGSVTNTKTDTANLDGTGALTFPTGTTAQRPASPIAGQTRYNTTLGLVEMYQGGSWQSAVFLYNVEYLVVAGGGGGGGAGGGGGGGVLTGTVAVTPGNTYTTTVGAGGSGAADGAGTVGTSGGASSIGSLISTTGGGTGGAYNNVNTTNVNGGSGGSGGGGGWYIGGATTGGSGTSGQGYAGGSNASTTANPYCSGGGGGAGGAGGNSSGNNVSGNGGVGFVSAINGTSYYWAGGGGGGGQGSGATAGNGGLGGGGGGAMWSGGIAGTGGGSALNTGGNGQSSSSGPCVGGDGGANTGGGGGGMGISVTLGGSGGSGIIIIRYAGDQRGTGGTVTSSGGYTIHTFTSSGTFTA